MDSTELSRQERRLLKQVAQDALRRLVLGEHKNELTLTEFSPALIAEGACFVTLTIDGQLRGCIGTLQAQQSLVLDVQENTIAAASRDPRFPPLRADELDQVQVSISILTPPKRLFVANENELCKVLRPGIDGLILEDGARRATYLPSVWSQLPNPTDFVRQLKRKAGLPEEYWSASLQCSIYQTISLE